MRAISLGKASALVTSAEKTKQLEAAYHRIHTLEADLAQAGTVLQEKVAAALADAASISQVCRRAPCVCLKLFVFEYGVVRFFFRSHTVLIPRSLLLLAGWLTRQT